MVWSENKKKSFQKIDSKLWCDSSLVLINSHSISHFIILSTLIAIHIKANSLTSKKIRSKTNPFKYHRHTIITIDLSGKCWRMASTEYCCIKNEVNTSEIKWCEAIGFYVKRETASFMISWDHFYAKHSFSLFPRKTLTPYIALQTIQTEVLRDFFLLLFP